jgi:hypothetical protein
MKEALSRPEDERLIEALRDSALYDYPNPERIGCPKDIKILKALALKKLDVADAVIHHVAECSPCFREMMQLRRKLKRLCLVKIFGGVAGLLLIATIAVLRYKHPASSCESSACQTAA